MFVNYVGFNLLVYAFCQDAGVTMDISIPKPHATFMPICTENRSGLLQCDSLEVISLFYHSISRSSEVGRQKIYVKNDTIITSCIYTSKCATCVLYVWHICNTYVVFRCIT